jgi:hypothetical protein
VCVVVKGKGGEGASNDESEPVRGSLCGRQWADRSYYFIASGFRRPPAAVSPLVGGRFATLREVAF